MKFEPLTEEQLQEFSLLPDGLYNYQVIKSEEKISAAGNEYIKLTLKIWDGNGKESLLFTNLALVKLLKHFCDVNELQEDYKSGNIPSDKLMYKSGGQVLVGKESEKPNPNGGMYSAKNIVRDYIADPKKSMSMPLVNVKKDNGFSDDLPF